MDDRDPEAQSANGLAPVPPPDDDHSQPPSRTPRSRTATLGTVLLIGSMVGVAILAMVTVTPQQDPSPRPTDAEAVVVGTAPAGWDPAVTSDAGSAATLSQVYEGLTAFDAAAEVRPALAESWQFDDGGRQVTFRMRPGLTFSDGTPLTAEDVRRSWLRVINPVDPGPLADLLGDVVGAREYLAGEASADEVGLRADGDELTVTFRRPASWFPAAAASSTLAVVPASIADPAGARGSFVGSGAYLPSEGTAGEIRLAANPRYWAGPAPLEAISMLTDLDGASPVVRFQEGKVDQAPIGPSDASWARYDRDLGSQLRRTDDLSVEFYGFDTSQPPFDDVRVRRAFAHAVDWDRLALLADGGGSVATSLMPIGIPGRGGQDYSPPHDPATAREELAEAGYPAGEGFPEVTLVSSGSGTDAAVATELERELGVSIEVETMPFEDFSTRLDEDPPSMWSLEWLADYPHPQDFLGLLLESDSQNNIGRWTNHSFDDALEAAAATEDPAAQEQHYATAQSIVLDEAPLVPVRYGVSWSLSRDGLLGAGPSGLGILRLAGLAWAAE
jgi:oligopeptide transport system substrate-binding protein